MIPVGVARGGGTGGISRRFAIEEPFRNLLQNISKLTITAYTRRLQIHWLPIQ